MVAKVLSASLTCRSSGAKAIGVWKCEDVQQQQQLELDLVSSSRLSGCSTTGPPHAGCGSPGLRRPALAPTGVNTPFRCHMLEVASPQ